MSSWSKWVVVVIVLAIIVPMAVRVARQMRRGEPFKDAGKSSLMPPSGPSIGPDGPSAT